MEKYHYSASWDSRSAIIHIDHEDSLSNIKLIDYPNYGKGIITEINVEDNPSEGSGFYRIPAHNIWRVDIMSDDRLEPHEIEKIAIDTIKDYSRCK